MATLDEQYQLANDAAFKNKVRTATVNASYNVAAATDRLSYEYAFANEVIKNPNGGWIDSMTFQVVANPAINSGSSDSDIQFTVNSNFEKVARAFAGITNTPNANPI